AHPAWQAPEIRPPPHQPYGTGGYRLWTSDSPKPPCGVLGARTRLQDRRDKTIPPPMRRLDILGPARVIVEHPAQIPQARRYRFLLYHSLRPERLQQFILAHEAPRTLQEIAQHGEAFRPQTQHLCTLPEPFVLHVKAKRPEIQRMHVGHSRPLPVRIQRNFTEISGVFQDSSGSLSLSSALRERGQGHTIAQNGASVEAQAGGQRVWPRDRAFVVQLHVEASIAPEGFRGRVEHVTSGQARHFSTLAECLAFIAQMLHERRAPRPCP